MTTRYDGPYPAQWSSDDSNNLASIKGGVGTLVVLLVIADLLLAASLVLGILAYNWVDDRLAAIQHNTQVTAQHTTP